MLDHRWAISLELAEETGDLRPLVELLLTRNIPDWIISELARLFTFRRLSVSRMPRLETDVLKLALREYRMNRSFGRSSVECFDLVAKNHRLSDKQQNALENMIRGKGRPMLDEREENKQAEAANEYEQSLRTLLKAYPKSNR